MENASKALIMAGSVLIALLIIGALLLMFNNLTSYQKAGEQDTREQQVIEFNNQFETYLRDDIRGSDMISLLNRIYDYNERKGDNSQEKFQQMNIKVSGIATSKLKYDSSDSGIIKDTYTQDDIKELINTVQKLEKKYQTKYITALSSAISKVRDSNHATATEEIEKILPKKVGNYAGGLSQIQKDTADYYQYTQFKRLHFKYDETKTEYSKIGRLIKIEFTCLNTFN